MHVKIETSVVIQTYKEAECVYEYTPTTPCPQCPIEFPKDAIERFRKRYEREGLSHEKVIRYLNELTAKAKNREMPYRVYIKEWRRVFAEYIRPMPEDISKQRFFVEIEGEMYRSQPPNEGRMDYCRACGNRIHWDVSLVADFDVLPHEPKYRIGKPKRQCPKCGRLGSSYTDKRGYVYYQHFVDGKRKVCYIKK